MNIELDNYIKYLQRVYFEGTGKSKPKKFFIEYAKTQLADQKAAASIAAAEKAAKEAALEAAIEAGRIPA